jgi:hypothetical protein
VALSWRMVRLLPSSLVSFLYFAVACGSSVTEPGGGGGAGGEGAGSTGAAGGAPMLDCPTDLPINGANCDTGGTCSYQGGACGSDESIVASCVASGDLDETYFFWDVPVQQCNGDPSTCDDYDHPTLCAADTSCRWLVPGCGEGITPDFDTGCYSAFDCGAADCAAGQICTEITYDPCHVFCTEGCASCGACGSSASLCLAP